MFLFSLNFGSIKLLLVFIVVFMKMILIFVLKGVICMFDFIEYVGCLYVKIY